MTLGERIKVKREEKGMAQATLAKKVGYGSRSAISMIEADKRDIPLEKVREIAKVLEVSPNWLMGWADNPLSIKTDLEMTADELEGLNSDQLARIRDYIRYIKYEGSKR